jgi:diaminopimelate decarboxylase
MINNELIGSIVKKYGTPMFIYDKDKICQRIRELKNALPPEADLYYPIKTNPLVGIVRLIREQGCKAQATSATEITIALKAGFSSSDIIFTGPGKTRNELDYAIRCNIYCIIVESFIEIQYINAISLSKHVITKIGLRVNPGKIEFNSAITVDGISQFGISAMNVDKAISEAKNMNNVKLIGLHAYVASQIFDADIIINNTKCILGYFKYLAKKHSLSLEFCNFGGGFGVPYNKNDSRVNKGVLKQGLSDLLIDKVKPYTKCAFTSGRYLLAEAGVYATKILYTKESINRTFIIVDGESHYTKSYAFSGRYTGCDHKFTLLANRTYKETIQAIICGKQSMQTDMLAQKIVIHKPRPGDILVFNNMGAYGHIMNPAYYSTNPPPIEILHTNEGDIVLNKHVKRRLCLRKQLAKTNKMLLHDRYR